MYHASTSRSAVSAGGGSHCNAGSYSRSMTCLVSVGSVPTLFSDTVRPPDVKVNGFYVLEDGATVKDVGADNVYSGFDVGVLAGPVLIH